MGGGPGKPLPASTGFEVVQSVRWPTARVPQAALDDVARIDIHNELFLHVFLFSC